MLVEKEYEEVLVIYEILSEENPKMYLPDMAAILNNLAHFYTQLYEYQKAIKKSEEALKIYRKLADENPKSYLLFVAKTLNNLSRIYLYKNSDRELSLKYANEALEILGKCDNTPFVRNELHNSEWNIKDWN